MAGRLLGLGFLPFIWKGGSSEPFSRRRISKREIIRRLGTSATQFYRILDQTNYRKSIDQVLGLLHVLDCDVDLVVKDRAANIT